MAESTGPGWIPESRVSTPESTSQGAVIALLFQVAWWLPAGVASQKSDPVAGDMPRFARQHTNVARKEPEEAVSSRYVGDGLYWKRTSTVLPATLSSTRTFGMSTGPIGRGSSGASSGESTYSSSLARWKRSTISEARLSSWIKDTAPAAGSNVSLIFPMTPKSNKISASARTKT